MTASMQTADAPTDESAEPAGPRSAEQRHEDQIVEERAAVGSHIVYKAIRKTGDEELNRPAVALAFSGLAAGLSMGFSLVTEGLLRSKLPDAPWRPLITKLGYSVGFLIVILGRQQLFTENTLTPMLPLLQRRDRRTLTKVARLWATVLAANILGAAVFAYAVQRTSAFDPAARQAFLELGMEAMSPTPGTILVKGLFAGWLIALMVWLLPVAEAGRIWIIVLLTYVVGLGQLSHVIAGSVDAIYTVASGRHGWAEYAVHFLLPTLTGNCLGGVTMVAALNYAQVAAGGSGRISAD
jgi:formate/nitrite transporter FocA (FNT family)